MHINNILVTALDRLEVPSGNVLHAMKSTDRGFDKFGEAYFSFINFQQIKAWKRHLNMTLNIMAPIGNIEFVFIDVDGNIRKELIGSDRYVRLTVPPGIWFGFKGISYPHSLLMNIANIIHDPKEIERLDLSHFKYSW